MMRAAMLGLASMLLLANFPIANERLARPRANPAPPPAVRSVERETPIKIYVAAGICLLCVGVFVVLLRRRGS